MVKPKELLNCPKCSKIYKVVAWFEKHKEKCVNTLAIDKKNNKKKPSKNLSTQAFKDINVPFSSNFLSGVFNFEDDFFSKKYFAPSFPNYLENLKNFGDLNNGLKIVHLNINSIFLKKNEINDVISLGVYDIISINETKLDETVPISFFEYPKYTIIRRDRLRDGGGIMVLIKKNLKILKTEIFQHFEGILVSLLSKGKNINILFSYKPPTLKDKDFLEFLENYILSINTNEYFLIVGDLNMDHSDADSCFSNFLKNFSIKTVTNEATRIGLRCCKKGETNVKMSKIDHIICQEELDPKSEVFGCP